MARERMDVSASRRYPSPMRLLSATNLPRLYIILLPIGVSALGVGVWGAAVALILGIGWLWLVKLAPMSARSNEPIVRFETISASHYVEKARWCLDRLGVPYREEPAAGVLGVFFTGRLVPRLHVTIGPTTTTVGGSSEIARYLFGKFGPIYGERAEFLRASAEDLELEARIDTYGLHVRRWIYAHLLPERDLVLRIWGGRDPSLPRWQRVTLRMLYPVLKRFMQRALRVTKDDTDKSRQHIDAFVAEIEGRLAEDRRTLTGNALSYIDISIAALSAPWVRCDNYGGGRIAAVWVSPDEWPTAMQQEMVAWQRQFPRFTAYVRELYEHERLS